MNGLEGGVLSFLLHLICDDDDAMVVVAKEEVEESMKEDPSAG